MTAAIIRAQDWWEDAGLISAAERVLRVALVFLLSALLSMAAPLPASVSIIGNRLNTEDFAYFIWEHSNQGKFWEIETAKTPAGLKHLQDASGMTEVMRLSENIWMRPSLHDLRMSKIPLAGFSTLRGYTYAMALALMAEPASAKFGRGGVGGLPNNLCPFGTGVADNGCSTSPGGSFQVANFFTGYTGTVYPARPAKNEPGVDYTNGVPAVSNPSWTGTLAGVLVTGACGLDSLVDPKTQSPDLSSDDPGCGKMPKHCAYGETVASAQLTISGIACSATANNVVVRGFELSATGGHGATYLSADSSVTGKKIFAFNRVAADASAYYQNSFGSFSSGSSGDTIFYADTQLGHWIDSFSARGTGSCTISSVTMTCNGSETGFAAGQYVQGTGVTANSAITSVSGHTYTLNQSSTVASPVTVTSQFQMAGGMNLNTSGAITLEYSAFTQINGRIVTAQQRGTGGSATSAGDATQLYNFVEGGIYTFGIAHWEVMENIIADGTAAINWANTNYSSNVIYLPSSVAGGSNTAAFFISYGNTALPVAANFAVTYTNVTINSNVVVSKGGTGTALAAFGGSVITNYTEQDNWIDKTSATTFTNCTSNPFATGGQSAGPVSFFHGQDNGAGTMTVNTFDGGTAIIFDGTNIAAETHGLIAGAGTGSGGTGTYTTTGALSLSNRAMRSAYKAIINAPTMSGNTDLITGSPISASNVITRTLNTTPCVYPGMQ